VTSPSDPSPSGHIDQLVSRLDRSMSELTRSAAIRRFYQRLAGAAGVELERPVYLALKYLATNGSARISSLARQHGVEVSTMSRHVTALEAAGLVTKRPFPEDRRVALAEATDEGRDLVDRVEGERQRLFAEVLENWERTDVESLVSLIERFNADLAEHLEGS
jgi:DNA-binding MarR family transcriptional regulator